MPFTKNLPEALPAFWSYLSFFPLESGGGWKADATAHAEAGAHMRPPVRWTRSEHPLHIQTECVPTCITEPKAGIDTMISFTPTNAHPKQCSHCTVLRPPNAASGVLFEPRHRHHTRTHTHITHQSFPTQMRPPMSRLPKGPDDRKRDPAPAAAKVLQRRSAFMP
mmetsp:Transcript_59028/g.97044  ORF Transcript_59028/g.97044 Transcript_59028/m.97044 type:complete len:165 (-) Transcript_59028:35-529(-)